MVLKSGVECEYFLVNPEGTVVADTRDVQSKKKKNLVMIRHHSCVSLI